MSGRALDMFFGNINAIVAGKREPHTVEAINRASKLDALGRWQQPHLAPAGPLVWTKSGRIGSAGTDARGRVAAVARRCRGGYLLRVEGWLWRVTPEMGVARFNSVPGDKIKETPVKKFDKLSAARAEAEFIVGGGK